MGKATMTRKAAAAKWVPLAEYVATKDPGRVWTVHRHAETGEIGCNCPAWRFSKDRPRLCKHTIRFRAHPEDALSNAPAMAERDLQMAKLGESLQAEFADVFFSAQRLAGDSPIGKYLVNRSKWREVADRLMKSGALAVKPTSAAEGNTGKVGVRRIVLDD